MTEKELWDEFLKRSELGTDAKRAGEFGFEARGFFGAERLALLLAGKKTAAFFSYASYAIDNEELPLSDEHYIVLDGNGEPVCVIKTTAVRTVPFGQVTWEMAAKEGEDESLAAWREKTRENLEEEGELMGFEFSPDMALVYVEFELAFRAADM